MKIYYLIPDIQKRNLSIRALYRAYKAGKGLRHFKKFWINKSRPVGGIKVIYQHCELLRELGFDARLLKMGSYKDSFFKINIPIDDFKDYDYDSFKDDVIVCPEIHPYEGLKFKCKKKILFNQNWRFSYKYFKQDDDEKSYIQIGYDRILVVGEYIKKSLGREDMRDVHLVSNFLDERKFIPDENSRIKKRVMAFPRKNPKDIVQIRELLKGTDIEFVEVDGLSESDVIKEYQKSDVFLATGYPEGFGLPPLEAMRCGAAVVGFTGGGASEFMLHDDSAMVCEDGDVAGAASFIKELMGDEQKKERIRLGGLKVSIKYSREQSKEQIGAFYDSLFSADQT